MPRRPAVPDTVTCDWLAENWTARWPRADPLSNDRHDTAVRRFGAAFKFRPIGSLTPEECRFFAEANPGHVRYLITMFNDAIGDGLLGEDDNPWVGLRIQAKGEKKPARVPTIDELKALEEAAQGEEIRDALTFSAYTGLRLGECRAFSLDDLGSTPLTVDVADRAQIDWQLTTDDRLKIPKKESRRRVMIPRQARRALVHRAGVLTARKVPGFWSTGRAKRPRYWEITSQEWAAQWTRIRKTAGVQLRWHDLRHHAATWLLDHGALVPDVAVQLGCSVLEIERTYGHPDPEKALGRLLTLVDDGPA